MRKALLAYHLINIFHLLFYALIFLSLMNYFQLGNLMQNNAIYLIGVYVVLYFGLNLYARRMGNNMANPIVRVKLANYLHAASIILFAFSFLMYYKSKPEYAYLMLVSFPMEIFAIVLAYRAFPIPKTKPKNFDEI